MGYAWGLRANSYVPFILPAPIRVVSRHVNSQTPSQATKLTSNALLIVKNEQKKRHVHPRASISVT